MAILSLLLPSANALSMPNMNMCRYRYDSCRTGAPNRTSGSEVTTVVAVIIEI